MALADSGRRARAGVTPWLASNDDLAGHVVDQLVDDVRDVFWPAQERFIASLPLEGSSVSVALTIVPTEVDRLLDELRQAVSSDRAQLISEHEAELATEREMSQAYRSIAAEYRDKVLVLQQQVAGA